jgi:cytochrome c5
MQGPHHASPIKNWKQLVVVIVLAFAVPIAVIVLLSQYVTDVSTPSGDDSAVLNRIKPVGEVVIESAGGASTPATAPGAPTPATPAASATAPKPAAPTPSTAVATVATTAAAPTAARTDGKKIYDTTCTACHTPGVAGAPKLGDKAAWAPRLKAGMDAVYVAALKGKGAMPAKGGNASLPDADVKAAVDYMVSSLK